MNIERFRVSFHSTCSITLTHNSKSKLGNFVSQLPFRWFNQPCMSIAMYRRLGSPSIEEPLLVNQAVLLILPDYFIEQEAVRQNKKYNDVYREFAETAEKLMKQKLSEIIKEKKSFIWDQINISENIRRKKITRLKQNKYEIHAIAFSLNEETWKNRIDNRVNLGGKIIKKKVFKY